MGEIVFFGDSLSGGRYGVWFGRYLKHNAQFHGIDGQFMHQIIDRAKRFCLGHEGLVVVVEGGANDIVLGGCGRDEFSSWEKGLSDLRAMCNTLLVCTIPPVGEDPKSDLNRIRCAINYDIRSRAKACGYVVADIAKPLESLMSGRGLDRSPLDLMFDDRIRLQGLEISDLERESLRISDSRGFGLTTDGLHLNSRGAMAVGECLDSVFNSLL